MQIDLKDITHFINNRTGRSLNLEFRPGNELSLSDDQKINKFSVTVAAFANTTGGKLIYGVETKRNKAASFSFVNGNDVTLQEIKNILNFNIHRTIIDLQITPLVFDNDNEKTVFVINIPKSPDAPHISYDNRYYKRSRFSNVVMEEHEIRMLYKKSEVSELEFFAMLNTNGVPTLQDGKIIVMNFYPRFLIKNISKILNIPINLNYHFQQLSMILLLRHYKNILSDLTE